jgi:hypothetical protein
MVFGTHSIRSNYTKWIKAVLSPAIDDTYWEKSYNYYLSFLTPSPTPSHKLLWLS